MKPSIDPKLDLVLERTTDIKPELVWRAWTESKLLMEWFCPRPWKTVEANLELKPGGQFRTVMQSPEGDQFPGNGCVLEVELGKKLVWTSALQPGFRPAPPPQSEMEFPFTATVLIESNGTGGTKYTAIASHRCEADRKQHEQMGFEPGWGAAFDQLVELMKK